MREAAFSDLVTSRGAANLDAAKAILRGARLSAQKGRLVADTSLTNLIAESGHSSLEDAFLELTSGTTEFRPPPSNDDVPNYASVEVVEEARRFIRGEGKGPPN